MNRKSIKLARYLSNTGFANSILAVLAMTAAGPTQAADNFNIEVNNGDIAVDASNASLTELLEELEKLTGIPVNFVAETDERVTLNVSFTDIENAIGKITPNHMIVHGQQEGKAVIKELIIIPDSDSGGTAGGSAFLPSGEPAPSIQPLPVQPTDQPNQQGPEQAPPQPVNAPQNAPQNALAPQDQSN